MSNKLTADTITNDDILDIRPPRCPGEHERHRILRQDCDLALQGNVPARARVAEFLNTRESK